MVINHYPLVSIITPVYNGSEYLEDLIASVLNQDYPNVEHLVIDDGSQDNDATVSILRRYPHLRWWSRVNKGQYATMSEGLEAANGEIICFVSADDLITPGAISSAVGFLSGHPHYDGVFGATGRVDSEGNDIPYYIPFQAAPLSFYPYFAHISHCSLYIKKEALTKHNLLFDPTLRYVGDYDWIIRIYKAHLKIGPLRQELSRVRMHMDQTSRKHSSGSRLETREVIARHKISQLAFAVLNRFWRLVYKIWNLTRLIKNGELTTISKNRMNQQSGK